MRALRHLPTITNPTAFNLDRWDELCTDPFWGSVEGKIETDAFGQVIMNYPAEFAHGGKQFGLGSLLEKLMPGGKVTVECPISTEDGIKVPDVVWVSEKRLAKIGGRKALSAAPEICVEVLSPSNKRGEIEEKCRLYFAAGAKEVWICDTDGQLHFFLKASPTKKASRSKLCAAMPDRVV